VQIFTKSRNGLAPTHPSAHEQDEERLPDMVAFIASILATVVLLWGIRWYQNRTPVDHEFTWGEAMLFATYVFLIFFWVYGVVPHQWMQWADSELNWRPDRYLVGPQLMWTGDQGIVEWALPFTLSYSVLRDFVAVGIYGVFFGGNIVMWKQWQNRDEEKAAPTPTSEYGRPLIRDGAGT
jgi:hypothetical protein